MEHGLSILRVEALTYGVEDIERALQFCTDFGLEPLETGAKGGDFRTGENQIISVRGLDDDALPPALESGSTLRLTTWGVDSAAGLERVGAELSADRNVQPRDGALHTIDQTGYHIAFRVAEATEAPATPRAFNFHGSVGRWNHFLKAHGGARPVAIAHVVLDLPREGRERAIAFYVERLNFKPTDILMSTGAFLQCEGNIDHHQLFLCHRSDRVGLNHVAFDVRDFDELIEGGNRLVGRGWEEVRPMGRHTVGSNMYRFFASPCGGRFEYSTDMDKVAKSFPTRVWEESPPHHLWAFKTSA